MNGVCGPKWMSCVWSNGQKNTCAEICDLGLGDICIANGCSGLTAILFDVYLPDLTGFGDYCDPTEDPVAVTMTGPCDEQIPWLETDDTVRHVNCCCGPADP
jgi:hypothetical protein